MVPAKNLLVLLLTALASQCASGPAPSSIIKVSPDRGAVALYQNTGGLDLSVINQSSVTREEGLRQRKDHTGLKVIPDSEMQLLADRLEQHKFFEIAGPDVAPGARHWVTVQHQGQRYVASNNTTQTSDQAALFLLCVQTFMDVYNANDNFAGSKMTKQDMKRESQEVNESSKSIDRDRNREKKRNQRLP